jgi:hypothetical protein
VRIDVMVDIETLGTAPGAAVLSVGALAFDVETMEVRGTLLARIRPESCEAAGLTASPASVGWWMRQDESARVEAFSGVWELREAAEAFCDDWGRWLPGAVWARGPEFDLPIWGAAMRAAGVEPPWRYWQARDVRTVLDWCGVDRASVARAGAAHTALGDCEHQLACLRRARGLA